MDRGSSGNPGRINPIKLDGSFTTYVNAGIKNTWGDILDKTFTSNIFFENRMPSVKIHGKGNILPTSGRLLLPFDAINLNAVDISIIKIYENNVPQFLQENDLAVISSHQSTLIRVYN